MAGKGFNAAEFDRQIKIEIDAIEDQLKETAYKAADKAMEKLAKESPVWSGTYVSSHRVGLNSKNDGPPVNLKKYEHSHLYKKPGVPDKVSVGVAREMRSVAATRVQKRIRKNQMPDEGKIIIYNQSPDSPPMMVEHLPDKHITGDLSPYMPYTKTSIWIRNQIKSIIKQVEALYKR
jgi:hypothetical protein